MMLALVLAAGLFEQSLAKLLQERFVEPKLSYMVMRVDATVPFAERWADVERPIAPGSLLKPFLASTAPLEARFTCRPGRCWIPRGHGKLDVVEAIAQSCNDWFRQYLAGQPDVESRIGLGSGMRMRAQELLHDYARLESPLVLRGMERSARSGTGRLVGADCFIKTGTAPCAHDRRTPGDGFAVVLFPTPAPRYVLLVRLHGTTGANAAKLAGQMVRAMLQPE